MGLRQLPPWPRACALVGLCISTSAAAALTGCGDDDGPRTDGGAPGDAQLDGGPGDGGGPDGGPPGDAGPVPEVPLDPESPWPKFRANALQNGRTAVEPRDDGSAPWVFQTGKGIFSTPVIDGDGNVYVGSADRVFYSIAPDGTERWSVRTGEIIDSSALLDDRGRVYFGSGDGHLRALDRDTGDELWSFAADDPAVNDAFINWFEGNVAIGLDGTLYAPNDNFCTYAVDRDTGERRWCFRTPDQTWSLPALEPRSNRLFIGNNFPLGNNVYALDPATGDTGWQRRTRGSVAASALVTSADPDGLVIIGSFDGFVYAYRHADGAPAWTFGARDHVYASAGQLSDGTLVQPGCDGTIYALDPADGSVVWSFDTLEPIRSSPAIDDEDHIYVGSGEGRLFVLNPEGTLRWSMRLIDDSRNDLNASPALGRNGIVIAGESGGVFFVPYDYCLRPMAESDPRCFTGGESLPDDGVLLLSIDSFGQPLLETPALDANAPLTLGLYVREGGDTTLALIDSASVEVTTTPEVPLRVDVSGDRRFLTVIPEAPAGSPGVGTWAPLAGGTVAVRVRGDYLVNLDREGLRFSGGTRGGGFDTTLELAIRPRTAAPATFPIPAAPGDPSALWELYRLAAPLPTVLPSYNQIGFDSIHYLVGLVEGDASHAIAWGIGAAPAGAEGATIVDPASSVRFALVASYDDGLLTLANEEGFTIDFNGFPLPFASFRVATSVEPDGAPHHAPAIVARAICGDIDFYGTFLRQLGLCNPDTDLLTAVGGAEMRLHESGVQSAPAGLGTVTLSVADGSVTARFAGSTLAAEEHNFGILLVAEATDLPVVVDYVQGTTRTPGPTGTVEEVALSLGETPPSGAVRAYAMVDAYPAAVARLVLP